jgi:hypothetical protein
VTSPVIVESRRSRQTGQDGNSVRSEEGISVKRFESSFPREE